MSRKPYEHKLMALTQTILSTINRYALTPTLNTVKLEKSASWVARYYKYM